jgi:hypothetical protein
MTLIGVKGLKFKVIPAFAGKSISGQSRAKPKVWILRLNRRMTINERWLFFVITRLDRVIQIYANAPDTPRIKQGQAGQAGV